MPVLAWYSRSVNRSGVAKDDISTMSKQGFGPKKHGEGAHLTALKKERRRMMKNHFKSFLPFPSSAEIFAGFRRGKNKLKISFAGYFLVKNKFLKFKTQFCKSSYEDQ